MTTPETLSHCAEEVRRYDRDRFLTALFASGERREGLFALYAFNLEVSKVREVVSEPTLGAIRLQWWREALDEIYGDRPVRRHAVAEALAETVRGFELSREHFDRLIDTRMRDLEEAPPEDRTALADYAEGTSATLVRLAVETMGVPLTEGLEAAADSVGIAWATIGLLRAMPHHLGQGRVYLPTEVAERHGVDQRSLREMKPSAALASAVEEIAGEVRRKLADARRLRRAVPKQALPALLPAVLTDGYLRRLAHCRHNVFDPRLAERPGTTAARLAFRAMTGRY